MCRYFHRNIVRNLQEYEHCKGARGEAKKSCYNKSMTDEFKMLRKRLSEKAAIFMTTHNNTKNETLHNAMEKKGRLLHEILVEPQKKNTMQQKGGEA